jgi:type IV secretory pathway TraG/TraD family ATPase VirD4
MVSEKINLDMEFRPHPAECLNYDELCVLVREIDNAALKKRVQSLESYETKDIKGLQAHLHVLVHSELGEYFTLDKTTFTLTDIIANQAIVYFALPALRFPTFAKVLGKLIMNDLKAVIDRQTESKKIFAVFDEYSVFAGEQSLNLVNMGREKGLHSIYGTQGLAELDKVDKTFRQQLMNCVNTLICHRINDQEGAEAISEWVGTHEDFNVTAQITTSQSEAGMGSVRKERKFFIHPDAIKQKLETGDAFYVTKVGGFKLDRVRVEYS